MDTETATNEAETRKMHFIEERIESDIAIGKWGTAGDRSVVTTRFPPEPNGFLHIGHAKSICLNFGLAEQFGGRCYLRFDDTNPAKEEQRYVDSIVEDVRWLGFEWVDQEDSDAMAGVRFASDYFDRMYEWAKELIAKGKAYVDEQDAETIREQRGTLKAPGMESPFRDRSAAESLELFEKMRTGEFADGSRVLRAKIDMTSPNMNLRDPVMYRVVNASHHRQGDAWHIYPMYDWAHGLEDSIEGITHSICTLEFEDHRPLYDWFIEAINEGRSEGERILHPQQIEFARWNPSYTITSKRKLLRLVEERKVSGWDDPRMPTISGLRRRGFTPESIRAFCDQGGVTKFNALIDVARLENAVRDDLNRRAPRRMCVLDPLKVVITNWDEHGEAGRTEWMEAVNNPEDEAAGSRKVPFGKEIYIERQDFMEDAPKKFFRLKPGGEVRLRYAYWVRCEEVVKNDAGEIVELRCTYDPETRGGNSPPADAEGKVRKVKGTLHWVSAEHGLPIEVHEYDRLFMVERPDRKPKNEDDGWDWMINFNKESLDVRRGAIIESEWSAGGGDPDWVDGIRRFQFERHGYYCLASQENESVVFNKAVGLKDSWAKQSK
ncbi:MAG: glutamine--tRNA ligase/YqeY domain fusion protein [Planctomycetota bacterium]